MSHSWIYGEQFSYSPPVKYKGLINQGATCYLNSVLQVLFMTEDFRAAVERYPGSECIDLQLKSLFGELRHQITDTFDITKKLDIKRVYEQRDAAEYFEKILHLTSKESSQVFSGVQAHRSICSGCNIRRDTDGKFWHLPLTLENSNSEYSVVNGLKKYFRPSVLSGENQIYCEKCDAKCDTTFDCVIKHHPEVLTLLLKRFELDPKTMTSYKINSTACIPYTLQIPENQMYELYAVVDHVGDLKHGHYTACVKSQEEDRWFKFDDARVTEIDFQSDNFKRSNTAYLLFYRKQSKDIVEVSAPDCRSFSTRSVQIQCQETDVNGGERQDNKELNKVEKMNTKGRQKGGIDFEYYRVDEKVKGDFKAALEVNSGAGKVETRKYLTKFDLVFNTAAKDVVVSNSMQNMGKGSSNRYESYERHKVESEVVQRMEEQKRKEENHLQKGNVLMRKPEGETDQDRVTHPVQEVEEKLDLEPDSDGSSSTQTGQTEAEGEVRETQSRAESEGTVGGNQSSNKSGTCIVRIYEEEKRVTSGVTVRSREKMDIKLETLKAKFKNRGGSLEGNVRKGDNPVDVSGTLFQFPPFLERQNKKNSLDLRNLLAVLSPENMFVIRCQSPASVHETRV